MHDSIINAVMGLDTAREVWHKLEADYGKISFLKMGNLKASLYNIKYTSGSMTEHLRRILDILAQIRGAGCEFPEQDLIVAIVSSLPTSYESWIGGVLGQGIVGISSDEFIRKLREEGKRRISKEECEAKETAALQVTKTKKNKNEAAPKKKEERSCYNCGKKGHLAKNCRKPKKPKDKTEEELPQAKLVTGTNEEQWGEKYITLCARGPGDNINENTWCIDSGATNHMVNDRNFFKQLKTYNFP